MAPGSHLSLHIPLLSRGGRRSPAGPSDQDKEKRQGVYVDDVALPASYLKGRPVSLPILNAQGIPKQSSLSNGTLKHNPHDPMAHHRRTPLSHMDPVERPSSPSPLRHGRRRSQTLPLGLPAHMNDRSGIPKSAGDESESTPRGFGRFTLFPVIQSPDAMYAGSPTPTATKFDHTVFPVVPSQAPITDRQRRAPPKVPAQQLIENVKKDNEQLKELLDTSNMKVSMVMNNLAAEEMRSDELENKSKRLEASLQALSARQASMLKELKALRAQVAGQAATTVQASQLLPELVSPVVQPPRRSSKRPTKVRANILEDGQIQLEIALRASKLATVVGSDDEAWVHPANRSSSSESSSVSDEGSHPVPCPNIGLQSAFSDDSSDLSFKDINSLDIEQFCTDDSPSAGPEFWDPSYYEGAGVRVAPLSIGSRSGSSRNSDVDPLAITSLGPTPRAMLRQLQLSPIPSTPTSADATPRSPLTLRLNTNLTPRQRGLRAAGVMPALPHRPSNVNVATVRADSNGKPLGAGSPLVRPSGPRPSYAARKMSMQGHLMQTLQASPEAGSEHQSNMASTYRPERRPSSIVRALAIQGFGMGANGAPLGMRRASSYAGSTKTGSGSLGSGSGNGSAIVDGSASGSGSGDSLHVMDMPQMRRTSSAWSARSSACSPKTLKQLKWTSQAGAEVAN